MELISERINDTLFRNTFRLQRLWIPLQAAVTANCWHIVSYLLTIDNIFISTNIIQYVIREASEPYHHISVYSIVSSMLDHHNFTFTKVLQMQEVHHLLHVSCTPSKPKRPNFELVKLLLNKNALSTSHVDQYNINTILESICDNMIEKISRRYNPKRSKYQKLFKKTIKFLVHLPNEHHSSLNIRNLISKCCKIECPSILTMLIHYQARQPNSQSNRRNYYEHQMRLCIELRKPSNFHTFLQFTNCNITRCDIPHHYMFL